MINGLRAPFLTLCVLGCVLPASAEPKKKKKPKPKPKVSSKGYIEMPVAEDGAWVLTARPGSGRNWGRPVFIRYLVMVAREWKRRHPEGPFLRLGDLSKPDGSNFPPHKTHKDGLTADIFTSPKNICHVRYKNQQLTLELAQLMYDLGARQILYNHPTVTKALAVAKKWPKHDDHFHVVIDPSRVPDKGALLVLPEADVADGSWVSRRGLAEDLTGLRLSWRVLGEAKLKRVRVLFDDLDDQNGVLHDSGPLKKLRRPEYQLPIALEHGKRYRWRVELDTGATKLACGWQGLQTDLEPPKVDVLFPNEGAKLDAAPTLIWRYTKPAAAQASYRIELDKDTDHRRLLKTLGPFKGAATRHTIDYRLRRSKRYHFRVVVTCAHGNETATEWRTFKTTSAYGKRKKTKAPPPADEKLAEVTASSLNMRGGPGTSHPVKLTLKRGESLRVLGEQGGWLEVEVRRDGKPTRGFVSAKFVRVK